MRRFERSSPSVSAWVKLVNTSTAALNLDAEIEERDAAGHRLLPPAKESLWGYVKQVASDTECDTVSLMPYLVPVHHWPMQKATSTHLCYLLHPCFLCHTDVHERCYI